MQVGEGTNTQIHRNMPLNQSSVNVESALYAGDAWLHFSLSFKSYRYVLNRQLQTLVSLVEVYTDTG